MLMNFPHNLFSITAGTSVIKKTPYQKTCIIRTSTKGCCADNSSPLYNSGYFDTFVPLHKTRPRHSLRVAA